MVKIEQWTLKLNKKWERGKEKGRRRQEGDFHGKDVCPNQTMTTQHMEALLPETWVNIAH